MPAKKDRMKDMLREMALMRRQKDEDGSVYIHPNLLGPEAIAFVKVALEREAGLNSDDPDHMHAFAFMALGHAFGDFRRGTPKRFPITDAQLLSRAADIFKDGKTKSDVVRKLCATPELKEHGFQAVRVQLNRSLTRLRSGKIKLDGSVVAKLRKLNRGRDI